MERVTANGVALAWEEHGRGDPPLVVVPQWFLSSRSMRASPLVRMLAERRRVVLFDRRGTGSSDKPGPPYTNAHDAGDLAALLAALDLRGAVLLGLGVRGSQVALACAGREHERVGSLVCIGGTPKWAGGPEWPYGIAAGTWHRAFAGLERPGAEAPGVPEDAPDLADAMRADWEETGGDAAMDILSRTLDEDLRPMLRRVTCPALVVHLKQDPLVTFEAARWLAESLPHGQLELLDAGRGLPLNAPGELAEHIEEFLRATGAG